MDLEAIRLHCERMMEWHRGDEKAWTSAQMLSVASDLQRIIENQRVDVHLSQQMERLTEENRALLEENLRLMHGRLWTTFKYEDGSLVMGEYGWMTEIDAFEEDALDRGEQVRVLAETWRLVHSMIVLVGREPEPDEDDDDDSPDQLPAG